MIYLAHENREYSSEIDYAFDILMAGFVPRPVLVSFADLNRISFRNNDLVISYGKKCEGNVSAHRVHIYQGNLFGKNYLRHNSLPVKPLNLIDGLPVVYNSDQRLEKSVVITDNGKWKFIEINIDLIASTYFQITRYEEVLVPQRDHYHRFPVQNSLASQESYLQIPLINAYISLMEFWLGKCNPAISRPLPWGKHDFAACITHDVDTIEKFRRGNSWRHIAKAAISHRDPFEAFERMAARIGWEPYDTFKYILKLNRRFKLKSSFYFLAGENEKTRLSYQIDSPRVIKLINRLKQEYEIGLHAGFESFNDVLKLQEERCRLEVVTGLPVRGVRQHYLRFQVPLTWRYQEAAGFLYDTTLSFPEEEGFRCGICTPFQPFDLEERRKLDLWEVPLTVMDGTLFDYQKLGLDEAYERIRMLVDIVRNNGGVFVLLWHNSMLDEKKMPGIRGLYKRVLRYISDMNPLTGSVGEIVELWRKQCREPART